MPQSFLISTRKIFFPLICVTLALSSCISDKQTEEEKFLTSKTWLLLSTEVEADGQWTTENSEECKKDNTYDFAKDGSFIIRSGAIKCSPGDPDELASGTWKITNNGERLIAKVSASNRDLEIVRLNSTSMILVLERGGKKLRETYGH